MDRRDVLKIGLTSAIVVVARELIEIAPGGAATVDKKKSTVFYEGTVNGKSFSGWKCLFAKTGKSVRGTLYDPTSVNAATFVGFRARGSVGARSKLELNFYTMDDIEFQTPLGSVNGKATNKSLGASFDVSGETGQIESQAAKTSAPLTAHFAGTYNAELIDFSDGRTTVGEARIVAKSNGSFTVDQIQVNVDVPVQVPNQITGRFGITADDEMWMVTLVTPQVAQHNRIQAALSGNLPTPSEVNKATFIGGPGEVQLDSVQGSCGLCKSCGWSC
jgi:hypothetical protein